MSCSVAPPPVQSPARAYNRTVAVLAPGAPSGKYMLHSAPSFGSSRWTLVSAVPSCSLQTVVNACAVPGTARASGTAASTAATDRVNHDMDALLSGQATRAAAGSTA